MGNVDQDAKAQQVVIGKSSQGLGPRSCSCDHQSKGQSALHLLHAQLLPVAGAEPSVRTNIDRQRRQSHKVRQVCVLHPLQCTHA